MFTLVAVDFIYGLWISKQARASYPMVSVVVMPLARPATKQQHMHACQGKQWQLLQCRIGCVVGFSPATADL
jgi:hypothetical protein